mmetsp:Transcript_106609/g.217502  ORF Transcript_106609/g.217502 Transcript_106609/m.217502 type:complete len:330 (-) Transcript_106609:54-1043(-)
MCVALQALNKKAEAAQLGMQGKTETCWPTPSLSKGFLRDNLPTGGKEPEFVSLNKCRTVPGEAFEESLEVRRDQVHLDHKCDNVVQGLEEDLRLSDQGALMAAFTRLTAEEDLKTGLLEGIDELLRLRCPHRTNEGLHLPQDLLVVWVFLVVSLELHPIQRGDLRSGLQHSVPLTKDFHQVDGVGEHLDLVDGIEALIRPREGIVVVCLHKTQLLSEHLRRFCIIPRHLELTRIDVEASHLGTCVCRYVVGDTTPPAAHVQYTGVWLDVELVRHALLLPEHLIAEDASGGVHDGRNVHLFHLTDSTQVVHHLIIIHGVLGLVVLASNML